MTLTFSGCASVTRYENTTCHCPVYAGSEVRVILIGPGMDEPLTSIVHVFTLNEADLEHPEYSDRMLADPVYAGSEVRVILIGPGMDEPLTSIVHVFTLNEADLEHPEYSDRMLADDFLTTYMGGADLDDRNNIQVRRKNGKVTITVYLAPDQHELEYPIVEHGSTMREFIESLENESAATCS